MTVGRRYNGFVIGCDSFSDKTVWKVRVKDNSSPCNEQKLSVASIRDDIALASGLNVHFEIGTVGGIQGREKLMAVDLQLETPKGSQKEKGDNYAVKQD